MSWDFSSGMDIGPGRLQRIDHEQRAFLLRSGHLRFDFGDLPVRYLQTHREQDRGASFFDDYPRGCDALPHVENVLAVGADFRRILPEAFAEFHVDRVFGESKVGAQGQFRRIMRHHRVEVLRDKAAKAGAVAVRCLQRCDSGEHGQCECGQGASHSTLNFPNDEAFLR